MARPNSDFRSALRAGMIKKRREARKALRAQALKDRVVGEQRRWHWSREGLPRWQRPNAAGARRFQ